MIAGLLPSDHGESQFEHRGNPSDSSKLEAALGRLKTFIPDIVIGKKGPETVSLAMTL
jgi:hypothetical protein